MGLIFGLIKRLIKFTFYFALFVAIITLIPNLPPYSKFSSIELEPTLPSVGPLEQNGALNNPQKLYKNKLVGPEAFQVYKGEVYTGLATGEIVKLSAGGHVTFVTKIGKPCQGLHQEHICGRPLGFDIDEAKGDLYVADAYYGIWKVNIQTDKKQLLVSPDVEIKGRKPMLFNDVALSKNGDLYWTDSSSEFKLHDGVKSMFTDPSGRLIHYNAATKKNKVLLDGLWFPNGVIISPDNQFVLFSETSRFRIMKYYIDGPKKGKSEVFLAGLPGAPDNLRALPDGSGVQVGLYVTFGDGEPFISKSLAKTPIIRKFIVRMLTLAEMPFEFLNKYFPNVIFEDIVYNIGSFKSVSFLAPPNTGLLIADWSGNVVASYHNNDGTLGRVSDAIFFQDKLYIGSPHAPEVGAVAAPALYKQAYARVQNTPPPKTASTVTEKIPKSAEPKKVEKKEAPKVDKAKPVETVKTTTPKPVERKPETTKKPPPPPPTKQSETKSTTPKPREQEKVTVSRQKEASPTTPPPKVASPSTPPPPKTTPPTTPPPKKAPPITPPPKTLPPKQADTKKDKPANIPTQPPPNKPKQERSQGKAVKEEIPIKEEIPSDTAKPPKETLKVIKKGGPTEIPNPNL